MAAVAVAATRVNLEDGLDSWIDVWQKLPASISLADDAGFESLWDLHPEQRTRGRMLGELMDFPRWDQLYGQHSYAFAGMDRAPAPIENRFLQDLLGWVQQQQATPEDAALYTGMLVNWFGCGLDYIGEHRDNEKDMVAGMPIYSFSFGQGRDFVVSRKDTKYRLVLPMRHNSLLVMGGAMQQHYKHAVPKRALSTCPGRRINVTIRPMRARA
jgi:alkylated DNA repair dioxygenase AlkB